MMSSCTVTVGSPPQEQVMIVDTGSSDLYFDASTASACESNGPHSCRGGSFNPGKSSTYKVVDESPAFNTSYGDILLRTTMYNHLVFSLFDLNNMLLCHIWLRLRPL